MDAAIAAGADGAECDVNASADGMLVVMHDGKVDRTTDGTGKVTELTLAELKKLDAGSWKDPKFAGEPVPTLDELLQRHKSSISREKTGSGSGRSMMERRFSTVVLPERATT